LNVVFRPENRPAENKLSDKLAQLLSIENEISNILRRNTDRLRGRPLTEVRDLIKEALHQAYDIAYQFGPKEMSIQAEIGVPPRVSVSFTWPIAEAREKEDIYDELFR
jgi:hypothetical protein